MLWCKYDVYQVRLISDTTHELLRRVPDCLADVYRVGSTAPGKTLHRAPSCAR